MRCYHKVLLQLSAFAVLLMTPQPGRADILADALSEKELPQTLSVELGFDHAVGKYGNSVSTTTNIIPFSLLYFPTERLDLGLLLPYIRQSNGLVVGGRLVRGAAVASRTRGRTTRDSSVSGIGDLVVAAGYLLLSDSERLPQLRLVANLKAPTAGTSLGTGEFDETLGLGLSKILGNWYLFLDGGYTFQGKTSLFVARNFAAYDLGLGYEVLPGLRPSLALKGTSSAQEGVSGNLQVEGKLVYAVTRAIDLKFNLDRGLSVSSPDWEGGCSLSYNF
jgi:hypothetical protein